MIPFKVVFPTFISLALLTSCSSDMASEESFQRLQVFRDAGKKIGIDRCERPSKVDTRKQANVHYPEVRDIVRTLHCPNVVIEIYESRLASNPALVQKVTALRPIPLPFSIGVGSTRAQVEAALGKPTVVNERGLKYSIETDSIYFLSDKELITQVIWSSDLL